MAPVNLAARAHAIAEGIFALPIERREEPYSTTVAGLIRLALEEVWNEALEECAQRTESVKAGETGVTTDERIEKLTNWLMACQRGGSINRKVLSEALTEFADEVTTNEQHDIGILTANLTHVYEHFAGLSKPMTDPEEVIRIAEERWNRETDEARDEALEEAACAVEALKVHPRSMPGAALEEPYNVTRDECAAAIRALKTEKPS